MPTFFRTQVHVLAVDGAWARVELPGWGEEEVLVKLDDLPVDLQAQIRPGFRCHARANLAAETPAEIQFRDWDWGVPIDPDQLRADIDSVVDQTINDPYERADEAWRRLAEGTWTGDDDDRPPVG